jgi:colanic acid biosynthesis glycosyl transferase WcaI
MKKILLISYNFNPEPTGIGKYNGEMMAWLVKQGYDCTVITTYPYYPYWKVQEPYFKNRFKYTKEETTDKTSGGKLTTFRCPMYVPSKPSGLKRMLLDFSFIISALLKLLMILPGKRFDYVITVAPSFEVGLLGVLYKKLRSSKLIYHIQDLQIEAARDLQMIKSNRVINTLFSIERYILNNSDVISSISDGMVNKIQRKAGKEVLLFPNWTDTNLFFPIQDRDALKEEFGFSKEDKIVLYSGAIGEKQGLESIIYAAQEFKEKPKVKFIICGSGPYKEKLQELTQKLKLHNVVFFPLQPFEKFNKFLNFADVHLVIQKANASDLVMPSKLSTILAVGGLALITANKGAGLHSLVEKHDMGFLVDAENQHALNAGIEKVINGELGYLKQNARIYAESYLSIKKVMLAFEERLLQHKSQAVFANAPSTREVVNDTVLELNSI